MTYRLLMTKKDPRRTDFVLVGDHPGPSPSPTGSSRGTTGTGTDGGAPMYTSDTTHYAHPRNGTRATTTITRIAPTGDRLQVGVIEWPVRPHDPSQLVVGTRNVHMSKSGIYTSPERFTAADGHVYEWQIEDARPQLVPLRTNRTTTSYVAVFSRSESGFWLRRKHSSSLFIPPEGFHILDDIIVTFIYFESKWRDKEGARSTLNFSGPIM